jgi:uncharacterized ferritin-like protein (DUF455 family)
MQSREITEQTGWRPFKTRLVKPDLIRAISTKEGIADRLRVVAFAELQARDAFLWGVERFPEAPADWRKSWAEFALVEDRHAQLLLNRMSELGVDPGERWVSDKLTKLCKEATDPVTFLFCLSSAEERGMEAGMALGKQMQPHDAISAAIFAQIAQEEVEHVNMAKAALAECVYDDLRARAKSLSALIEARDSATI